MGLRNKHLEANMATKAQLELLIEELKAALAGAAAENEVLRARLNTGIAAFKTARGEIARLNEIIAGRRAVFVKPRTEPKPTVTRFYRGGVLWEKTRLGNMATERLVSAPRTEFHVVAGKYDGDEENCKFADVRATREAAEALLATVSDYPWSRIEERAVA